MTPEEYKKIKAVAQAIAPFFRPGFPVNAKNPEYNEYIGKAAQTIRQEIHDERARWRIGQVTDKYPSRIVRTGQRRYHGPTFQRIKNLINERFSTGRTDVDVQLDRWVRGEKVPKKDREQRWANGPLIRITVGHMWERKVYREFYRDKNLDNDSWFVLSANEVRVNKKHQFRLFEAMLFRAETNFMTEGYVVKATIGKEKADIALTAPQAIEKGLAILDQAVRERVIQKEDI